MADPKKFETGALAVSPELAWVFMADHRKSLAV
jgi:hypothetical protein